MNNYITIIGGTNIDYMANSIKKIMLYDSNPSNITISFGGVGHNICENLLHLHHEVNFISPIGTDVYGQMIKERLVKLGCHLYYPEGQYETSKYLAVCDELGDLLVAGCDESSMQKLTIAYLTSLDNIISHSQYLILDGNLPTDVINYIFNKYQNIKIIVDATSQPKALKFKSYLDKIYLLKVNMLEAMIMFDNKIVSEEQIIETYKDKGVVNLIITNGSHKILYYENKKELLSLDLIPLKKVVNTVGAGDALLAKTVNELTKSKCLKEALIKGVELAQKTCLVKQAVYGEEDYE